MAEDELELGRDDDEEDQGGEPDPLLVEALMGWDGDPCECPCGCQEFQDGDESRWCPRCRADDHEPR